MKKKKLVEPFIVTIDDLEGMFEAIYWAESFKDANEEYKKIVAFNNGLPDKQGRHARLWVLVKDTTGYNTSEQTITEEE